MLKKQKIIVLILLSLVTSCSSLYSYQDRFHQLLWRQQAQKMYDENPYSNMHVIFSRQNDHSKYSYNGYTLWLGSISHQYAKSEYSAENKKLTQLNYTQLTVIHDHDKHFIFSYESQLTCPGLDIHGELTEWLTTAFPAEVFQQFQLPYAVNVHFVLQQSFHTLHRIVPGEWELNFYFPIDCQAIRQPGWSNERFKTIAHEITHIEQYWIHDNFKQLISLSKTVAHTKISLVELLGEYHASKVGLCAMIPSTNEAWLQLSFELPENFTKEPNIQNIRQRIIDDITHSSKESFSYRLHSTLGGQLAYTWASQFADEDGYIFFNNDDADGSFMEACRNILSEEAIVETGYEIKQLLTQ